MNCFMDLKIAYFFVRFYFQSVGIMKAVYLLCLLLAGIRLSSKRGIGKFRVIIDK